MIGTVWRNPGNSSQYITHCQHRSVYCLQLLKRTAIQMTGKALFLLTVSLLVAGSLSSDSCSTIVATGGDDDFNDDNSDSPPPSGGVLPAPAPGIWRAHPHYGVANIPPFPPALAQHNQYPLPVCGGENS